MLLIVTLNLSIKKVLETLDIKLLKFFILLNLLLLIKLALTFSVLSSLYFMFLFITSLLMAIRLILRYWHWLCLNLHLRCLTHSWFYILNIRSGSYKRL